MSYILHVRAAQQRECMNPTVEAAGTTILVDSSQLCYVSLGVLHSTANAAQVGA